MSVKPFAILDRKGTPVQRFATYRAAEDAAVAWCREKRGPVDVCDSEAILATVRPHGDRAHVIDLTVTGSAYA